MESKKQTNKTTKKETNSPGSWGSGTGKCLLHRPYQAEVGRWQARDIDRLRDRATETEGQQGWARQRAVQTPGCRICKAWRSSRGCLGATGSSGSPELDGQHLGSCPCTSGVLWGPAHPRWISQDGDLNVKISDEAPQGRLDREHHLRCSAVGILESEKGEKPLKIKNQPLPKETTIPAGYYSTRRCVSYNRK